MVQGEKQHVAIIDIGSNAVRMVIFDDLINAPFKIHNERIVCNLGSELATTNRISSENFNKAIKAIARFSRLITAMGITKVRAVATAALRDAENGKDFIAQIKRDYNFNIDILDGDEEARISALGVMSNGMAKDGIIGDYGGGSLELIVVENSQVIKKVSLPIGSHRLLSEKGKAGVINRVNDELDKLPFLNDYQGKRFYALGGSWRSMAKAHIHMIKYPIRTLDHYCINGENALDFIKLIIKQNPTSIEKTVGLPRKRVHDIRVAAIAMLELFKRIKPSSLVFSGTGLREGLLFEQMSDEVRSHDFMVESCKKLVADHCRSDDENSLNYLYQWMEPLFKKDAQTLRLLRASCYLSDISFFDHEEYQAEHAFNRILVMPFYDITHRERAFLALTQHVRYKGFLKRNYKGKNRAEPLARLLHNFLTKDEIDLAFAMGMLMHIAYLLTGGELSLLQSSHFTVKENKMSFTADVEDSFMYAGFVENSFYRIAEALNLEFVN
jgi:exopolyphosphatase/guanosine-5'-triphosphate,3'-diphosphate pyrophosphatase